MARIAKKNSIRKNELMNAAEKLFYEKGYEKTSIAKIIDSVGVAKGTFYHYFKSKSDLLNQIIEREAGVSKQRLEEIVNEKKLNALEKINKTYSTSFNYRVNNKELFKMLLKVFYLNDDNILFSHKRNIKNIEVVGEAFTKIIVQGNEEKLFDVAEPSYTAEMIVRIGFQLDEVFARLLIFEEPTKVNKSILVKKCKAYENAVERLLGLSEGKLKIVNKTNIDKFYEE